MLIIWGAIKVMVFALCVGAVIAVVVLVPLGIYSIPYALWVGSQNTRGKHMDKKKEKLFRSVRNATKLYKSWITRTEPNF